MKKLREKFFKSRKKGTLYYNAQQTNTFVTISIFFSLVVKRANSFVYNKKIFLPKCRKIGCIEILLLVSRHDMNS